MKGIEEKQIEAPYELPEGWKWVKQNEVCKLTDGEKLSGIEYPYLEVKYLRGTKEKVFQSSGKFVIKGTKVILVDGENSGEVFTVPEDGFMGSTFKSLEISNVNENYLQYFIHTKKDLYRNNKKGSAIPHLDKKLFFSMPFPLPPTLAEQQRIVNRIESMFAKLDEAKEKAQNVVDGFETRKAAILHKAFTGELTAKWRKENDVSDDSWEIVKLEDIVKKEKNSLKAGPFGSALKKDFYVSKGYKIYGQEQVLNSDENYGDYFIDEDKYKELESCKVAPNDILISLVGTIGKTLILSEKCKPGIINPRLIKISLDVNVMIPQFFTYYFGSDYCKSKYKAVQHGTTMDVLNMGILKQLEYPCCTLPEQVEIVRILDIIIEKENKAKQAAETVLEQIDLLKKSILARAFRGEL